MYGVLKRFVQEAVVTRKALRASRIITEVKLWSPEPLGLKQRVRQSWCFLTAHRWNYETAVNEAGHTGIVRDCLRCGLLIEACLDCALEDVEDI